MYNFFDPNVSKTPRQMSLKVSNSRVVPYTQNLRVYVNVGGLRK